MGKSNASARTRVALASAFLVFAATASGSLACGDKSYCKDMSNCAEATYYLQVCEAKRLDGDGDGIPCEALCGKSPATHQARLMAQTNGQGVAYFTSSAVGLASPAQSLKCEGKATCSQMTSCEEARFYLSQCAAAGLDGNSDGVPCNGLCN